jgi:hypothetical protein
MEGHMRIILYFIFVAVAAGATVDTLQPDATLGKDAFVYEGVPTQNFGYYEHLSVTSSEGGHQACSYIEFVELPNYFGVTINQVTLELYVLELSYTGDYNKFGASEYAWDENAINWQNQPWAYAGSVEQELYPSQTDIWWQVDVTDIVLDWVDGTFDHYGFNLFDDNGDGDMARFGSSDNVSSAVWPKLVIDYTGSVGIESVTLGELKTIFR